MRSRFPGFAALVGATLLVACIGDPAGPTLNLTAATTSGIVVRSFMDQSPTAVPAFVSDTGLTRFNLYKQGDTTLVASITTPSSGGGRIPAAARGILRFYGIVPGTYVVRPQLRAFSSASSAPSTVPQLGDSAVVTVTAGNIDSTSSFNVRLGASLSSVLAIQWTDSVKVNIVRLPGVTVTLQRETVAGNGIYADVGSVVTDPIGAFTIPLQSIGGSMGTRLRTNFTTAGITAPIPDIAQFNLGGFVAPPGTPGSTLNGPAVWTQVGTAGNSTNQNISVGTVGTANAPFSFQFSSIISGRVFRDLNANGLYDGVAENLAAGDTVVVQLRNNDVTPAGTRVIATSRALTTIPASYSFSGLRAGNYRLTVDLLTSRIAGKRLAASPGLPVPLSTSSFRYTQTPVAPALANPIDVGVAVPP